MPHPPPSPRTAGRARLLLALASLLGALGVAMGAWAAHGLAAAFGEAAAQRAATGAHYQLIHALAVFAALWHAGRTRRPALALAAAASFAVGAVLFPGALYLLALGGPGILGAVAPIGGLALILGWVLLAGAALAASRLPGDT